MAPTGSGRPASLILTVTRRCDLRCAYCPTAKDGEPDLSEADAVRALELFSERYGGGDCKLFGGEPLLVPAVVERVIREAPPSVRVYLSTNGSHLDARWIALLHAHPQVTLTLSLDGLAADHDGLRRGRPTHANALSLLPELLQLPRFVVTQTIAPSTARRAADNFRFLRSLGIRRFNLLPGYYLPWTEAQLDALATAFGEIAAEFEADWERGGRLYLRNLFTRAPTPFFNTGFVVDSDRRIYPSNLVLAGALDHLRAEICAGTLDDPPSAEQLEGAASAVSRRLANEAAHWESTLRVDALLTDLCNRLYPAYFARRGVAA